MTRKTLGMVAWYEPGQLLRTASEVFVSTLFGRNADPRIIEAFSFGKSDSGIYDYRVNPGGPGEDFWFDFLADTGDGWDSSYGMAYLLAQPSLTLVGGVPRTLPRGDLLILGGDLVYPTPSRVAYDRRFAAVFETALPGRAGRDDQARPHLFAIPGNHDWYDSLVSFIRLFVDSRTVGGWRAPQSRSYFALRLPGNWWLLGVDLQLGVPIDIPQLDLFRQVAAALGPDDRIIVCSHEPTWIYRALAATRDEARFEENLAYLEEEILRRPVDVFLAGDIHYYQRHQDGGDRHKIISGGGGALRPLLGTRADPDEAPAPEAQAVLARSATAFREQACYPPKAVSHRLTWRNLLFLFKNPAFGIVPAIAYLVTSWVARAPVEAHGPAEWRAVLVEQLTTILQNPFSSFWMLALFSAFWMLTSTSSRVFRWVGGTIHGVVHVLACLMIMWVARSLCVNSLHLAHDQIPQLLLTGLIVAAFGWVAGSFIVGGYLLISLNLLGEHSNEAFSSLRIADYKNFLRMKIDPEGRLSIYPIGVERVPRKWRDVAEGDRSVGFPSAVVPVEAPRPILIEGPINVGGRASGPKAATNLEARPVIETKTIGLEFTETMKGFVSTTQLGDFAAGERQGREDGSPIEFTVTINAVDFDLFLRDEHHMAKISGTVTAPVLANGPMTVEEGEFDLFVDDPDNVATRLMRYSMRLRSGEGKVFSLRGTKTIHEGSPLTLWPETTTLYADIFAGPDGSEDRVARGILHIFPEDFAHQLTTIKIENAPSVEAELSAIARFGKFFAGTLFDTYGGIFISPSRFAPDARPRRRRRLRVAAPEIHFATTSDGLHLRLTRYKGGTKGPLLIAHGLGVSSLIFSIDTIETNLLEFLFEAGYDCWLLDYRSSIELPYASHPYTGDDVATKDYPAAVDEVRRLTKAETIQCLVHCFGATTFFMAMLAGLRGVRSAAVSQVATHGLVTKVVHAMAGLHVPDVLRAIGVETLTAQAGRDWWHKVPDLLLKAWPVDAGPGDRNPTSRRISFIYGQLYELSQLNENTYWSGLGEMFGVAGIQTLRHLATIVRAGHIVGADGSEVYLGIDEAGKPDPDQIRRLAIPMTIVHGALNECWLPESTEITLELMKAENDPGLYDRHVVPGYGHIDCIFGKEAARDVYPLFLTHLEKTATAP